MAEAQARMEESGNKIAELTDKLMEFEKAQGGAESALNEARERVNQAERAVQEANYFGALLPQNQVLVRHGGGLREAGRAAGCKARPQLKTEFEGLQEGNIQERLQQR